MARLADTVVVVTVPGPGRRGAGDQGRPARDRRRVGGQQGGPRGRRSGRPRPDHHAGAARRVCRAPGDPPAWWPAPGRACPSWSRPSTRHRERQQASGAFAERAPAPGRGPAARPRARPAAPAGRGGPAATRGGLASLADEVADRRLDPYTAVTQVMGMEPALISRGGFRRWQLEEVAWVPSVFTSKVGLAILVSGLAAGCDLARFREEPLDHPQPPHAVLQLQHPDPRWKAPPPNFNQAVSCTAVADCCRNPPGAPAGTSFECSQFPLLCDSGVCAMRIALDVPQTIDLKKDAPEAARSRARWSRTSCSRSSTSRRTIRSAWSCLRWTSSWRPPTS